MRKVTGTQGLTWSPGCSYSPPGTCGTLRGAEGTPAGTPAATGSLLPAAAAGCVTRSRAHALTLGTRRSEFPQPPFPKYLKEESASQTRSVLSF